MEGSAAFLLAVLLLGVSCFLYLVGVELEEVGDAVGVSKNSPLTFRTSCSNMLTSHGGVLSLGRATGAAVPFKTSTFDISYV